MNLITVVSVLVCRSLWVSFGMLTVSNALLMSRETRTVREGGCFWLKPLMIVLVIL